MLHREYVSVPGGGVRRVYSVQQADGRILLADHEAWLASRAARCACGRVCRGSGRTCGEPDCIKQLDRP